MNYIVDRLDGEHDEDALQAEIAEMNEQLAWAERVLAAKETTLVHLLARSLADTTRRLLGFLNEGPPDDAL